MKNEYGRICKKCGEYKTWENFSKKNASGRKPNYQPRCKPCAAQDTKDWYIKNESTRKDRYLRNMYGITELEYNSMLLSQNNSCLLCGVEFSFNIFGPDSPVVDHCHVTGNIRGVLCNECNRGLGYFHDDIKALENAANYLRGFNAISKKWNSTV